jgi:hypothetical protein
MLINCYKLRHHPTDWGTTPHKYLDITLTDYIFDEVPAAGAGVTQCPPGGAHPVATIRLEPGQRTLELNLH